MFPPDQQLAIVRAVTAQRRAFLLDADNSSSRTCSLAEAVGSGGAYFVVPRGDLLVVDEDLPEDAAAASERAGAFDVLIEAADRAGVPHVVVASGREGHRHAYLVLGGGRARLMVAQWARERGLDTRERGVRPPGSPHRDGRHLAVPIAPRTPDEVVSVLRSSPSPGASAALARHLVPVQLPARVRAALRHGHAAAGYESASHARMALAVAVRSRSGPRSLLEMLLNDLASPLGRSYRVRGGRWRQQELWRLWDKAGQWLSSRPATSPALGSVRRWRSSVRARAWSGMAGGTDLAVAEVFAATGLRAGGDLVGLALGDIAVAAGVGVDTARSSVTRLVRDGWLEVAVPATARTSRVYRLLVPPDCEVLDELDVDDDLLGDLGADLARWGALGKVTMRLARSLRAGPAAVAELADALRMSAAAVRHHLRKLARCDLAVRCEGVWRCTAAPESVEELSLDFGTAGRRAFERAQLALRRQARAELLSAYRLEWLSGRRRLLAPPPDALAA